MNTCRLLAWRLRAAVVQTNGAESSLPANSSFLARCRPPLFLIRISAWADFSADYPVNFNWRVNLIAFADLFRLAWTPDGTYIRAFFHSQPGAKRTLHAHPLMCVYCGQHKCLINRRDCKFYFTSPKDGVTFEFYCRFDCPSISRGNSLMVRGRNYGSNHDRQNTRKNALPHCRMPGSV